jgi:hypothetical protein
MADRLHAAARNVTFSITGALQVYAIARRGCA